MTQLPEFVANLSPSERLDLIELLWDSLQGAEDVPLTKAQRQELESRVEALDLGELKSIPLDDASRAIRRGRSA